MAWAPRAVPDQPGAGAPLLSLNVTAILGSGALTGIASLVASRAGTKPPGSLTRPGRLAACCAFCGRDAASQGASAAVGPSLLRASTAAAIR